MKRAIVLSAGLGTRMRPLTERMPKPLVELGGKPLLEYALERFEGGGCERVVVNTHHFADQMASYLAARDSRAEIVISHEPVLLETGGGIVQALPLLGDAPFFAANSDSIWLDGTSPALERLRAAYDPERMDSLLLLQPRERTVGYAGPGDFDLADSGEIVWGGGRTYVFTGLRILHPRLFRGRTVEPFSLVELWRAARRDDNTVARTFGLVHEGDWLHLGSPAELGAAEAFLRGMTELGVPARNPRSRPP